MMRKARVLVADDDAPILRLVQATLRAGGYSVTTALNGQLALERVRRDEPDLVILDIMMPEMDGLTAMSIIRQHSSVPIIILSARSGSQDKVRSLDLGADDYITKPFDPEELSARVAALLRRCHSSEQPSSKPLDYGHLTIDVA